MEVEGTDSWKDRLTQGGPFFKELPSTPFWLNQERPSVSLSPRASEDFLLYMREPLEGLCFLRQEGACSFKLLPVPPGCEFLLIV